MNLKEIKRLQGQVFALQAFINSLSRTLEVTDPELFKAIEVAARPVLDDVRKSWNADDPMVAAFIETFDRLLGNRGQALPSSFHVVKGGKE